MKLDFTLNEVVCVLNGNIKNIVVHNFFNVPCFCSSGTVRFDRCAS